MDEEFSVFKNGQEYDYVTDLRDGFKNSLKKPLARRIFETIPDHVFWDIKKPQHPVLNQPTN